LTLISKYPNFLTSKYQTKECKIKRFLNRRSWI